MILSHPTHEDEGYWWVKVDGLKDPFVVQVWYRTWDHTRDGDMFMIIDGELWIEHDDKRQWDTYDFIEKIKPPEGM